MLKSIIIILSFLFIPIISLANNFSDFDHQLEGHWVLKVDKQNYLSSLIVPAVRAIKINKDSLDIGTYYFNGISGWKYNVMAIEIENILSPVKPISMKRNFESIKTGKISSFDNSKDILVSFDESYNPVPYSSQNMEVKYPESLLRSKKSILRIVNNELIINSGGLEYHFERINTEYEELVSLVSYLTESNSNQISELFQRQSPPVDKYNPIIGQRSCKPIKLKNLKSAYYFNAAVMLLNHLLYNLPPSAIFYAYLDMGEEIDLSSLVQFFNQLSNKTIEKMKSDKFAPSTSGAITLEILINHADNSSYETNLNQNIIDNFGRPISLQKLYPVISNLTSYDKSIVKSSIKKILIGEGNEEKVWWKQFSKNSPKGYITSPRETFYDLTMFNKTGKYAPKCN
jgi:hypothetical protein